MPLLTYRKIKPGHSLGIRTYGCMAPVWLNLHDSSEVIPTYASAMTVLAIVDWAV